MSLPRPQICCVMLAQPRKSACHSPSRDVRVEEDWPPIAANAARNRGKARLYRDLIMAQIPQDAPPDSLAKAANGVHYDSSAARLGRERHAMP
jgi:hypothetical protein